MAKCPRCGAENQLENAACWRCWAPIPRVPPPGDSTAPIANTPNRSTPATPVKRTLNTPDLLTRFPRRRARPTPGEVLPTTDQPANADEPPVTDAVADVPAPPPEPVIAEAPELPSPSSDETAIGPVDAPFHPVMPAGPMPPVEAPVEEQSEKAVAPVEDVTEAGEAPQDAELASDPPADVDDTMPDPPAAVDIVIPNPPDCTDTVTPVPEADPPARLSPAASRHFVFIGERTTQVASHGGGWLIAATFLLCLLLLAGILYWFFTLGSVPYAGTPGTVTQQYLFALAAHDTVTPHQLATRNSRGLLMPNWLFYITDAQSTGPIKRRGTTANTTVALTLTPTAQDEMLAKPLLKALSRTYRVTLILEYEHGGWRVDQALFFANLRRRMALENPGVRLPAWR